MTTHPEQQPNEKYLGNTHHIKVEPHLKHIPSLRYGIIAYCFEGKQLTDTEQLYLWPLFIARDELYLYDEALMKKTFPHQKYYRPQGI